MKIKELILFVIAFITLTDCKEYFPNEYIEGSLESQNVYNKLGIYKLYQKITNGTISYCGIPSMPMHVGILQQKIKFVSVF